MRRNENDLPEGHTEPAGQFIKRNPGVSCVYITRDYKLFNAMGGGSLVKLGAPVHTEWFAEGKPASRDEVLASIDSGYPLLVEMATRDGNEALAELETLRAHAMNLLPEERPT
jgi:hypothetical protein